MVSVTENWIWDIPEIPRYSRLRTYIRIACHRFIAVMINYYCIARRFVTELVNHVKCQMKNYLKNCINCAMFIIQCTCSIFSPKTINTNFDYLIILTYLKEWISGWNLTFIFCSRFWFYFYKNYMLKYWRFLKKSSFRYRFSCSWFYN